MEDNNNNEIHSTESVVDENFRKNTYKTILPIRANQYWLTKLFSKLPNIDALGKGGKPDKKAIKRMSDIQKVSEWNDMISKYMSKKSLEGYGAVVGRLVKDWKGETIPRIEVVEGVVSYDSFQGTDKFIEVIEKLTRGIYPILRVHTYGTTQDKLHYELDGMSINDVDKDDRKDIEKVLEETEIINHNLGFVRAKVFRNRTDAKHYDYGQTDLNGYEEQIDNLDITHNRLNFEIDTNSSHISRTLESGNIIGGDFGGQSNVGSQFDNQKGTIKETYRTLDTAEGVDSVLIEGSITLDNLRAELKEKLRELYLDLEMQTSYDAEGKTNDTTAKVDKIGDQALKGASYRQLREKEFWTGCFEMLAKLDMTHQKGMEIWKDIEEISVVPRINDFRMQTIIMDKIDKLAKFIPLDLLFTDAYDISPSTALEMVNKKETEMTNKLVGFLAGANGNLPQNIEVPFGFGEVKDPNININTDSSGNNDKKV